MCSFIISSATPMSRRPVRLFDETQSPTSPNQTRSKNLDVCYRSHLHDALIEKDQSDPSEKVLPGAIIPTILDFGDSVLLETSVVESQQTKEENNPKPKPRSDHNLGPSNDVSLISPPSSPKFHRDRQESGVDTTNRYHHTTPTRSPRVPISIMSPPVAPYSSRQSRTPISSLQSGKAQHLLVSPTRPRAQSEFSRQLHQMGQQQLEEQGILLYSPSPSPSNVKPARERRQLASREGKAYDTPRRAATPTSGHFRRPNQQNNDSVAGGKIVRRPESAPSKIGSRRSSRLLGGRCLRRRHRSHFNSFKL